MVLSLERSRRHLNLGEIAEIPQSHDGSRRHRNLTGHGGTLNLTAGRRSARNLVASREGTSDLATSRGGARDLMVGRRDPTIVFFFKCLFLPLFSCFLIFFSQ